MAYEKVKYDNAYIKENYDRVNLFMKKGKKDLLKEHYKKLGFSSMNDYINNLIENDMNK